jgi:double strand RNA binding domain from DEAD END PROTEIN 1
MESTNWFTDSGEFRDDKRDSRRIQMQNPSTRRPPPAVKRASGIIYQPAVTIFEGCYNKLGQNDSAVQCLQDFCQRMNLEQPQYKTIPIGCESDGKKVFNCKVQVIHQVKLSIITFDFE